MPSSEPAELLPWDSDFWGVRIGRVLGEPGPGVDEWARANDVACLYLRTPDEPGAVHIAEDAGFRLVEPRLTMTYRAGTEGTRVEDIPVREGRPEDLPALRELARRTRYVSRFAFDPRFAPRAEEYFAAWIELADAVLVAERDGRVLGYITCRLPESGVDSWFGIVAVDDEARVRGVGTALLGAGSDWLLAHGMETVSVAIAARNIATLRYVERFGFMASNFELWFHKWYDESQ
jgi:GNAT superfamily N-acetyltransferase